MPRGIGTDIVSIQRVSNAMKRTEGFAERILTEYELEKMRSCRDQASYLAKRFAAKEAVVKALGTGIAKGIVWHQIEISNDSDGAPLVRLTGAAEERMKSLGATRCLLSLSDEKESAVAFVIIS